MRIYKGRYLFLSLALATALFVVSACSAPVGTGNTNGTSSLTVLQVLQNSAKAMQKLKSVHFDTTTNGSLQGSNNGTATNATPATRNASLNLKGSGDVVPPDQESSQLTLNQNVHLAEIVTADKVYIQNTRGQWYVLDKSSLQGLTGNPFNGSNVNDVDTWLGLIQHVQLSDNGTETIDNVNLRHITATLDKEALKQLLSSNGQLNSVLGQQNIEKILDATKSLKSTLDVWIDESTFYVHRTELKFNLNADLNALVTPGAAETPTATGTGIIPANLTTTFDSVVNLSKFNEPVTITPPANAIPTDNPITIFSGQ
jgi:hypothetical protein